MKTESKALDKCQAELKVTLDEQETKATIKKVENSFVRNARLPGFRPGKVPLERIRKEFATQLAEEIKDALVNSNMVDAIASEKLNVVASKELKAFERTDAGTEFTVLVEVKPEIKAPEYKGLKIPAEDTSVTDKMLGERVEAVRAMYATYEDAKEGDEAKDGDFAQITYSGTIDGKPISEIAPDATIVAGATGFWMQVEEGAFLPEIVKAIIGMKVGETKEGVKAKFDKEIAPDALKGEKAVYTVKLDSLRHRVLPNDEELVKKSQAESYDAFVAKLRSNMEEALVAEAARKREDKAVELLLKKADFDVPSVQVENVRAHMLQDMAQRAQASGLNAEYFEKNRDKILKDSEEAATRQVRLWYIFSAIAKIEGIDTSVDDLGKKIIDLVLANAKD